MDPCGAPPRPSIGSATNVYANNILVHREGDAWALHACPGDSPHPATTSKGSGTVFANGEPIARVGDPISCGSTIAPPGSPTVFAGG